MKKKLTHFFKLALGALSLGAPLGAQATFAPVPITGFNQDVIANGSRVTAVASSTYDVDASGAGYTFMEQGYSNAGGTVATRGLPGNRIINSAALAGLTFRLGSYSANNVLRLPVTGQTGSASGTLTFATRMQANDVYLLVTGGNGAPTAAVTVNFADGSSQIFPGLAVPDWFNNAPFAMNGLGRVARTTASTISNDNSNPRFYQLKVTLAAANQSKLISSVTVAKTSTGNNVVNVFAVSVDGPACNATPIGGTATAGVSSACPSTTIDLAMTGAESGAGVVYQWQSLVAGASTWADITGADWPFYSLSNQADATDYRLKMTCAGAGVPAYSTTVSVAQNPFYNCYCTATSAGANEYIRSVSVNGASGFINTTNANSTNGYGDFTTAPSLTTTLNKGASYPLSVIVQANNNGSQGGYWIDYDQNGSFDSGEYTEFGRTNLTGQAVTFNSTLTVPNTSAVRTGLTRMRLRWRNNAVTGADACATGWAGETEDYFVTIGAPTVCVGTPPRTTAVADQTTVCATTPVNLTVTGLGTASGYTFQWQSSPAGANTYTNLGSSQTVPTYTVASQTAATDYRLVVTCTGSGASRTGTEVSVAQNNFLTCYCTPTYSNGGANDNVVRVQLGTLDNTTSGNPSPYYRDYSTQQTGATPTLPTPTVYLGGSAAVTITFGSDSNQRGAVWIDFNQNGVFGDVANEYVGTTTNAGASGVVTLTLAVPAAAGTGITKMRIRGGDDTNTPAQGQACGPSGSIYGEAEDYLVNIVAPVACAGTPATATATTTATTVCSTTTFTLSLTGIDPALTGISYQWQSSPAGANTFTNLGASQTTASYTVTGLTTSTDYRAIVTCANGGASSTSTPVAVSYSFLNCYCTPSATPTNEFVDLVTVNGSSGFSNGPTGGTSTTSAGYNDYTSNAALTTTLRQGGVYPVTVRIKSNFGSSQAAFWIDFDHSGTFDGGSEYFELGRNIPNGLATFTVNVAVPANALLGPTRMRVRERNSNFAASAACDTGFGGETEDYLLTIDVPQTCTTPPSPVVATASVGSACANTAFTLSTSSVPTGIAGYTFQWQSRPTGSGAAFADISGATSFSYSVLGQTVPTDYQLLLGCQYGGTPEASNIVAVGQNAFDQCYCTVSHNPGCSGGIGTITSVRIGTLSNTSTCAASPYQTLVPASTTTTSLNAGTSYTLTTAISGSYSAGVWIDYNQNGTFETTEFATINSTTTTINVPATALGGATRMRIRSNSSGLGLTSAQACDFITYGETEDYAVTIVPQTPCAGTPPTVTATASVSSACTNAPFTLSFASIGNITGLSYQWQSSPAGAGTFAAIGGATAASYTVTSQTAATDYRVVLTCANGGASATSNVVSVGQSAPADCYCKPTSSSVDEYFSNVTLGSINNTSGSSASAAISGYTDYTQSPTATQTTALMRGNAYTISVTARDNRMNSQALLWIDYNKNGVFENAEYTLVGTGPSSGTFPQTLTFTKSFTVPVTAAMGPTRLRVRWHNDNNSTDPCALGWNGETEDYTVNIVDTDLIVSTTAPIPAGAYNSITITGTGNGTLAGATTVATTLTVEPGGTFADGCQVLSGAGGFTAAPGSTLRICNPAGISASGATGAVQVTGARSFSPLASYEYNGTAAQVTGDGLPATVLNLMVNNAANVGLSQSTAVRRMLTLSNGDLNLGASNLTLTSTDSMTAMVVNSGSGRVQNTGSGVATMQRAASPTTGYAGPGYRHYSSPMAAAPISDLGTGAFAPRVNPAYNALPTPNLPLAQFPNVFDYQESRLTATYPGFDTGWHSPAATSDVLTPGKGYTVNIAPQTVDLSGVLNNGPVPTGALTHSGTANSGWQLLGNPYPAPLNWSLVTGLPAGVDASVYVFEPSSQYGGFYRSFVNGMGTNTFNGVLPAMQAFFVRTTQAVPGGFSFQNSQRLTSYQNPAFHRTAADLRPQLRLGLSGTGLAGTDETIVYLQDGATTGTDRAFDAAKLPNSSGLSLATRPAGPANEALAISGLPLTAASVETRLPLALMVPAAGSYRFEVATLANFDASTAVLLLDHQLNTRTDLRLTPTYAFTATQAGALNGRFELLLGRPGTVTGTAAALASQFSVWPNPATDKAALHLSLGAPASAATLTLCNVLGQTVSTQRFSGSAATVPTAGLATGTYLLTVQVAGQAPATRRVVIE